MIQEFSQVILKLRKERRLSQREVSEALGISQALLSHYEKGLREPKFEFVVKVCDFYDVSADYLMGRTKIRKNPAAENVGFYDHNGMHISVWENEKVAELLRHVSSIFASLGESEELTEYVSLCIEITVYKLIRKMCEINTGKISKETFEAICDGALKLTEAKISETVNMMRNNSTEPLSLNEAVKCWADITEGYLIDTFRKGE